MCKFNREHFCHKRRLVLVLLKQAIVQSEVIPLFLQLAGVQTPIYVPRSKIFFKLLIISFIQHSRKHRMRAFIRCRKTGNKRLRKCCMVCAWKKRYESVWLGSGADSNRCRYVTHHRRYVPQISFPTSLLLIQLKYPFTALARIAVCCIMDNFPEVSTVLWHNFCFWRYVIKNNWVLV